MSGIAGRVSKSKAAAPNLIDAMTRPMLHRPDYRIQTHLENHFQASVIHLPEITEEYFSLSPDRSRHAAFFGSIYEDWFTRGRGAASLLDRWRETGITSLLDLNGDYLIFLWDSGRNQLKILNDRLGQKSLYLFATGDTLFFASELKALLPCAELRRSIDEQALAELLTLGHFQGNRTLLRNISLLPGGSCLTWESGNLSLASCWKMAYRKNSKWNDAKETSREYAVRLEDALEKRLQGRKQIGILLGGGLDSRVLGGVLRKSRPFEAVRSWTTGHGHDHDSRFGKQIARVIQSQHQEIVIPETFVQDLSEEYVWLMDGRVAADGCHRALIRKHALGKNDVMINGFLGDVLAGTNLLEMVWGETSLDAIAAIGFNYYCEGWNEEILRKILRPSVFDRIQGTAQTVFTESLKQAEAETLQDHLNWLTIWFHLWGDSKAQVDLLSFDFEVVTPMSDKHFIDFILSLPTPLRKGRKAYLQMICDYFPELARVPRAGDGLPLLRSRLREALHWRWLKFYRKGLPKLSYGRLGGHHYAQYVHRKEWYQRASREFIEKTLIGNPVLEEHFQMDPVKQLVGQALDQHTRVDLTKGISSLISYAIFRQNMNAIPICPENTIPVKRSEGICV